MSSVNTGALLRAVKSGNLAEVQRVGDIMQRNGWTVNWMRHAKTANEQEKPDIRNYLARKATENANAKSTLKRGGAKRQRSRRRYTVRR